MTLPRINTGTYDKMAVREQYRTHLRLIQKSHPAIVAVSGLDHPPGGFLFPEWVAFFTGIRNNRTAVLSQVGIATGGGVLFFVQSVDNVVSVVTMFVVAFVSVMFLVLRYPERLSTAAQISARCSEIEIDVRALWSDIESGLLSQAQASSRWHKVEIALDEATVLETHIGTHKGINRKAEADAARLVKEEYAP